MATQTAAELEQHLQENIGFLVASCTAFDAGIHSEAKRLGTTIRVLLHDTKNSHSLLGLLGHKEKILYLNTANARDPSNMLAHHGLVGFQFDQNGPSYWAPLGDGPPTRYSRGTSDFESWWNEHVIVDHAGGVFTRKDLVLSLANKDGGAHVDPSIAPDYAALTRENSLGWVVSSNDSTETPLKSVELHSVRQIAYELLQSLRAHGFAAA